ncbi:hypothetical protein WJX73_010179 [Symbiochloris irregularis]|uniref:Amidase domain-containing protein n=1 Tax=Symbiochloris irregularis TaxID=706552 RepID=A0AAW1NR48_9CHLO
MLPTLLHRLLAVLAIGLLVISSQLCDGFVLQSNYTTDAISVGQVRSLCSNGRPKVPLVEATISGLHQAMLDGAADCSDILSAYTQRIMQFDKQTGLNSLRELNPKIAAIGLQKDEQLSQIRETNGSLPPMFCVPLLVKDNFDTVDMAACNGASSLLDNVAQQDATQVRLLKAAGAVVLAKANMAEWAFDPDISIGSAFGVVRNPYDLDHVTAGSSGGTAAGISANLGLMGLGSDTGNSIRGPAGHCGIVGIRSSLGLTSTAGILPLDITSDVGGPMGRTVEDTVRAFQLLVGYDPSDNLTELALTNPPPQNYTDYLQPGLDGVRVGIMLQTVDFSTADPAMMELFQGALSDIANAGAIVVGNVTITGNSLGSLPWDGRNGEWYTGFGLAGHWEDLQCDRFMYDMDKYLSNAGTHWRNVLDIVQDGGYHPSVNTTMYERTTVDYSPLHYPPPYLEALGYICGCGQFYNNTCRAEFRQRLIDSMDAANVDVLVYPTWSNPAELVGQWEVDDGNNSPQIAPPTGAPAMVVPMGFTPEGLPGSLQILARPFDEATMIRVAYGYEQATQHRTAPVLFPECQGQETAPWMALSPSVDAAALTLSGR